MHFVDELKNYLKMKDIFGQDCEKVENPQIMMFLTKPNIKNQIELMDEGGEKNQMEILYTGEKFLFTYDGITNNNPHPGHNIKEFQQNQFVVMEFSIHSINFRTKKNLSGIFNYYYCLGNIYFINEEKIQSTQKTQYQNPNDWVILTLRIRKLTIKTDIIKCSIRDF